MRERDATPGQTVGPFFHYGLCYPGGAELTSPGNPSAIRLHGNVFDGAGEPVPDALIELWQTDSAGTVVAGEGSLHRDGWTFTGWGRTATDSQGHYSFTTLTPGSPAGGKLAFFAIAVFARGLLDVLFTRAYLPQSSFGGDTLLAHLDPGRRRTLICESEPEGFRFDIHLQGDDETVFLTYPRSPS